MDSLLRGGIPKGSTVALIGPVGVGKSTLCKQFLYGGMVRGDQSILLGTQEPLELALEVMDTHGWNGSLASKLMYLDMYSWRLGRTTDELAISPASPSDLGIALSRTFESRGIDPRRSPRLVLDTLSDIVRYAGAEAAISFLDARRASLRERQVTSIVVLEEGLHDERTVANFEAVTDGTIRIAHRGGRREVLVTRMLMTPTPNRPVRFEIARGLELKAGLFFR